MTASVPVRRSLDASAALLLVFSMAAVLVVATWLFLNNGSPFAPGALIWFGWGLYPGAASILALRSDSEAQVTALAVLVPSLVVATFIVPNGSAVERLGLPLAAATGVFIGMWLGTAVMRRGGRVRLLTGLIAAGLLGGGVALVIGVLSVSFGVY